MRKPLKFNEAAGGAGTPCDGLCPGARHPAEDYRPRARQSGGRPGGSTWLFPPDQNPAAYRRVSPINYLAGVTAPIMLHHGTADPVVSQSASIAIDRALRAVGKDVTLHLYRGAGHALRGEAERLYFSRTLRFFQTHMQTGS